MNVEVKWHDHHKTIIQITYLAYLPEWQEFDHGVDLAFQMARSVPNDVIIIVDPRGFAMPKQGNPLLHLRRALINMPSNVKTVVGVIDKLGMFEQSMVQIASRVSARNRLKLVKSLEEAYKLVPESSQK